LISKYFKVGAKESENVKETTQGFQSNLHFIRHHFEESIRSLQLSRNHVLFIDGIDIRPENVPYETYIECLKGLAKAAWELNSGFFSNIKDSKGRIKVVLLLRPDIFQHLGYQNANAKARDNAVILDWRTDYEDFKTSRIFRLIDGIMGKQQLNERPEEGVEWNSYFPYRTANMRVAEKEDDPFIGFLRYSFHRPRDVISYLLLMQNYTRLHESNKMTFSERNFHACEAEFSDYLLGEVRDQLRFYFSGLDFDELTGFFRYMGGRSSFTWKVFAERYNAYLNTVDKGKLTIKQLTEGPEQFLQLLYSLNVIGYAELTRSGDRFIHYCFRDRSTVVLNPKVVVGVEYRTHAGLARALEVGGG
jgi:hypothetical protein